MKKLFALVLTMLIIFGLAMPAFAAETCTLTINDGSNYAGNRSYAAYKLMTVSVSADGTKYFYDVIPKYEEHLKEALHLDASADGDAIVDAVAAIADRSEAMHHFSDDLYRLIKADTAITADKTWEGKTAVLEHGYWLIIDTTNLQTTAYANSLVMVDTLDKSEMTINNKPKATTSHKHVDDENDSYLYPKSDNEDTLNWQNVADNDIGDQVPYTISIHAANDIAEYEIYSFVMCDSVGKGLTYVEDSFVMYVNGEALAAGALAKKGSAGASTAKFLYEIETDEVDGKQTAQRLFVYPNYSYTTEAGATVSPNKETGGNFLSYFPADTAHNLINNATIRLDYKCLLNENAEIGETGNPNEYSLKFSNNPYNKDSMGNTPKETAIVLTYQVVINKVDSDKQPLTGATFTLHKFVAETPDSVLDTDAKKIEAGYYYHADANTWGKYIKVETIEVDSAGTVFSFKGLDDGLYKLEETKSPAGYNPIDPIEFRIDAAHVTERNSATLLTNLEGTAMIGGAISFTKDLAAGSLTADVVNKSGSELPSTGGIGTTMFYIFGSLLFVGAGVLLITKKRMAA